MRLKILLGIFPGFIIYSLLLLFWIFGESGNLVMGISYGIVSFIIGWILFKVSIHSPQSHFENISKKTIHRERLTITFKDKVQAPGIIYRSKQETIDTPHGPRYPNPRPTIIIFHGFWAKKEINEKFLIPWAHMGYITVAFDMRGHGTAGGQKSEWFKLYDDSIHILDYISNLDDVKRGSICCIGKSMGGTSVLTKCYQDERVGMVIAISALHDIGALLSEQTSIFSSRWFINRKMSKIRNEKALEIVPRNYIKKDAQYNKNRVYLIHGKKDNIFPPSLTFELNKKQARIPDKHAILLEDCGHSLEDQELLLVGIMTKWIVENKKMQF
ncbi:MAG: hypothetical protein BAJALOKI1v1_1910003 [Promethearchaeota archaeon]|nr:MAG: hypothetical protein BAJALOKI1v1_1910003 [Candidatus Lokiarchaeota archaeon]